jgi:selenide,water dikinase
VQEHLRFAASLPELDQLVLSDAQTSGGLLIAVAPDETAALVERLRAAGTLSAAVIGEITSETGMISVEDA